MQCPLCHTENLPAATKCDCGYDFANENEQTRKMADRIYRRIVRLQRWGLIRPTPRVGRELTGGQLFFDRAAVAEYMKPIQNANYDKETLFALKRMRKTILYVAIGIGVLLAGAIIPIVLRSLR